MIRTPDDHFGSFGYRYPAFPVCFYGKPTLVSVFTNQKKSKEDFHFYRKRRVAKTVFSVWQGAVIAGQQRGPPSSVPGIYT